MPNLQAELSATKASLSAEGLLSPLIPEGSHSLFDIVRCVDTGRKCEGPATQQIRFVEDSLIASSKSILLPEVNLLAPPHTDDERWAFNYFLHRSAPIFAGVVDGPFWLDLVPRLAQSHAFVWDVVVSSSWMFEHVHYDELVAVYDHSLTTPVVSAEHVKALRWYQRALVNFRHFLERGEADNGYILLSCILFAALEFQQRNIGNAWRLIDNAFSILDQSLSRAHSQDTKPKNTSIYEFVTAFYSRKAVLMGHLGKPIPLKWNVNGDQESLRPSMKLYLEALKDAKLQLDSLMYQAYEVVRVGHLLYHDDYEMQKLKPRQAERLKAVREWKHSFTQLCENEQDLEIKYIVSTLLMYWSVCYVWLSACTSPLQTAFDKHMADFEDIVDNAQIVLQHMGTSTSAGRVLKCEGDPVPALLFVAEKCRDPCLRREALQLLRRTPPRDGLWHSVAAPSLVEQIIAVEEGDDHFSTHPVSLSPPHLPPEERRIHHIAIISGGVSNGHRRLKVQLTKGAIGADGLLRMVHEEVWVEERSWENLSWRPAWQFLCEHEGGVPGRGSTTTTLVGTGCQGYPKVPFDRTFDSAQVVLTKDGYKLT
ncbi:hypothetical protein H2200_008652 [Cladophialophora chaetospira]|uniref:Uncharacterized protein n=1 Tax=Cladophialophora chaetospira TaxID=386627 RepID=A0AA38X4F6_9EURO|nr:hypothetical protein H2200_008652 [Cladophialophora chaetospira]